MTTIRLMLTLFLLGLTLVVTACAAVPVAQTGPGERETSLGKVLTDANGMTLYTYDKDPIGKVTCTGLCAIVWPPADAVAPVAPTTGSISVIKKPDGAGQWARDGHPLYAYRLDKEPVDVKGEGVDGVWQVAR